MSKFEQCIWWTIAWTPFVLVGLGIILAGLGIIT